MERAPLSIGHRLEKARLEQGWTQGHVAEQIGVDPVTYRRWEHDEHRPQPIYRQPLCQLFGKTAQELGFSKEKALSEKNGEEQSPEEASGAATLADPSPALSSGHLGSREPLREGLSPPANDPYAAFRSTDLTTRLQGSVWSWLIQRSANARYHELQAILILELEREDNHCMKEDDTLSRRDALRRLASLPIEFCGLSLLGPIFIRPVEEILAHCAAGVIACWQLRKGNRFFVFGVVSRYIPTLQEIVTTGSTLQKKEAASLLTQSLILQSELARHVKNSNDAIGYAQQAEHYSRAAESPILQVIALRTQAAAYSYADRWEQALTVAEQAKSLLKTENTARQNTTKQNEPIPSVLQSYVYAGLATYQSYMGKTQDALDSLKKAHVAFFAQSADEALPVGINHNRANLVLNDGMTHYHLGMSKEAFDSFGQVVESYANSESIRVEAFINQVMAEVNRADKPRNRDICMDLWIKGMQGAIALQSEQRFNEARTAYAAMRAAWPSERAIRELREYINHW